MSKEYIEKTIQFFDSRADKWDENADNDLDMIKSILKIGGLKENQKVLDVGCGTGILFNDILNSNPREFYAIDASPKMIENAKSKFKDQNINLVSMDVFKLQEKDFDLVVNFNAYPHFNDKRRLAEKTYELLCEGGRFIVGLDQGKEKINHVHKSIEAMEVSTEIKNIEEDLKIWEDLFNIDVIVDTPDIYMFAGTKK